MNIPFISERTVAGLLAFTSVRCTLEDAKAQRWYDTLRRAGRLILEWQPQSLLEAGEVVIGQAHGALDAGRIVDLPTLYRGEAPWRADRDEIVVFKSVGIGLADVACAWLAAQHASRGFATA